jgi:carbon storage regulator
VLVLTRHVHQSIVIGHDVVVTVLEVRGDQVRLGITAPKDIQVHREEVFVALTAANRQAASSAAELGVLAGLPVEPTGQAGHVPPPAPRASTPGRARVGPADGADRGGSGDRGGAGAAERPSSLSAPDESSKAEADVARGNRLGAGDRPPQRPSQHHS